MHEEGKDGMTIDEFLAIVPKDGWDLPQGQAGIIRNVCRDKETCPITHVTNSLMGCDYSIDHFLLAGGFLGLEERDIYTIIDAADSNLYDEGSESDLVRLAMLKRFNFRGENE